MWQVSLDPEALVARYHRLVSEGQELHERLLILRGQALELQMFIQSLETQACQDKNGASSGDQ